VDLTAISAISAMVAPVVLMTTGGMITNGPLAMYGAVNDRMREMTQQRLELRTGPALADEERRTAVVVAMAGDKPVSSARITFGPGPDFAGLYSAATRPGWRGRGIYRAIVAYRARLAADRGLAYLRVETTTMSRPILRRLGFEPVTTTTTYVWTPPRAD
jgi:GNAT superfamily N-acetyltransferase